MMKSEDVMQHGIVTYGDFKKEEIIAIIDEKNKKPLAVGKSLFSSEEMKKMDKGKCIKNLHWIGDEMWEMTKRE